MIRRRFERSTSTPATGARNTLGNTATIVAVASTVAEPVFSVSHQTSANCTSWDPNSDRAWPPQNVKNLLFQPTADVMSEPSFLGASPLGQIYPNHQTLGRRCLSVANQRQTGNIRQTTTSQIR